MSTFRLNHLYLQCYSNLLQDPTTRWSISSWIAIILPLEKGLICKILLVEKKLHSTLRKISTIDVRKSHLAITLPILCKKLWKETLRLNLEALLRNVWGSGGPEPWLLSWQKLTICTNEMGLKWVIFNSRQAVLKLLCAFLLHFLQ